VLTIQIINNNHVIDLVNGPAANALLPPLSSVAAVVNRRNNLINNGNGAFLMNPPPQPQAQRGPIALNPVMQRPNPTMYQIDRNNYNMRLRQNNNNNNRNNRHPFHPRF